MQSFIYAKLFLLCALGLVFARYFGITGVDMLLYIAMTIFVVLVFTSQSTNAKEVPDHKRYRVNRIVFHPQGFLREAYAATDSYLLAWWIMIEAGIIFGGKMQITDTKIEQHFSFFVRRSNYELLLH